MQITLNERGIYQARYTVIENGRRKHKVTSLRTRLRDKAQVRAKVLMLMGSRRKRASHTQQGRGWASPRDLALNVGDNDD